jgi:chemotaxis protein CheD
MTEWLRAEVDVVRVGIAEGAVAKSPQRLRTSGLGSCVGIVLFDGITHIAGMVHIMLPECPAEKTETVNPTKYADSGIEWLIQHLESAGAQVNQLKSKIAGGAQMFNFAGKSDIMRVGPRNVEAVKHSLRRFRIPLLAEDVGGSVGRTIEFDIDTLDLWVRTAMKGTYKI